jgi:hypothetical protein
MRLELKARSLAMAGGFVCALWSSGCATVTPGTEPAKGSPGGGNSPPSASKKNASPGFSAGRALEDFSRDPTITSAAVTEALADLKMTSIKRSRDGLVYKIDARTEDDRPVLVTVRPHQQQSRVGCRVGWFGDEPLSKAILERVGIRLELRPPAPIPEKPPSRPEPNPFLLRDQAQKDEMVRDMMEAPYRDRVGP